MNLLQSGDSIQVNACTKPARRKRLVDYSKRKAPVSDNIPPLHLHVLGNTLQSRSPRIHCDSSSDSDLDGKCSFPICVAKGGDPLMKPSRLASSTSVSVPRRALTRTKSLDLQECDRQHARRRGSQASNTTGSVRRRFSNDSVGPSHRRFSNEGIIHTRRRNAQTAMTILSTATQLETEESIPLDIEIDSTSSEQLFMEPLETESNHDNKTPKRRGGKRSSKQRGQVPLKQATDLPDMDPLQFMQQYQQKMRRRGSCIAVPVPRSKAAISA